MNIGILSFPSSSYFIVLLLLLFHCFINNDIRSSTIDTEYMRANLLALIAMVFYNLQFFSQKCKLRN